MGQPCAVLFHILGQGPGSEKALKELEEAASAAKKAALPDLELEPQLTEKVDFDTFCKSDFRAVKVKDCQPVKKSEKLLKFTLDDGTGTDRQILSGIAKWYRPEDLIGKTLMAIVNLPPRKMMGQESLSPLATAAVSGCPPHRAESQVRHWTGAPIWFSSLSMEIPPAMLN